MDKSSDDAAKKVHNHREDGEESIKRTSKVVPIDGGVKKQERVENSTPPEKDKESSEVFDQFLDKMKARNVANRKKSQSTSGAKKD